MRISGEVIIAAPAGRQLLAVGIEQLQLAGIAGQDLADTRQRQAQRPGEQLDGRTRRRGGGENEFEIIAA